MICIHQFFLFLFSSYFINIHGLLLEQQPHIRLPSERLPKFTRLHFFFHDTLDTDHPTSVKIINPPNDSPSGFGVTYMVDNPLTENSDPSSKLIGRAQGTYASASQRDLAFMIEINFVFTEGKYKGSTLSMIGRNTIADVVRELPIVGGTGFFRFSQGYALAKTFMYNSTTGNAIEEFNVTVFHF